MTRAISLDLEARPYARPSLDVKIALSGNPCTVPTCNYLAGDGYVCPTCVEAWESELGNITALVEDLGLSELNHSAREMRIPVDKHDRLMFADPRLVASAEDQTVGTNPDDHRPTVIQWINHVAPGNRAASYWMGRLRNELVGQIRFICETGHIKVPDLRADANRTIEVMMAQWLIRQSGRLSKLAEGEGAGLVADLHQVYVDCIATIDVPARRKYVRVCECGLSVWATRETVVCACGRQYDVEAEYEERMSIARDSWVTIAQAANAGAAKEDTIKKWIKRGRIETFGTPQQVRYGDVLDLAADAKEKTA